MKTFSKAAPWRRRAVEFALATAACALATPVYAAAPMPRFTPDTNWLKLPNGWILGETSAVAVDRKDHLWVLQRPRTLADADKGHAAPPVMEFDANGRFVQGFGGAGAGYDWPLTEHSLAVDAAGHVWISGNNRAKAEAADDMVLEFSGDGRFIRQIGKAGASKGDTDTENFNAPADIFADDRGGEVYIADGYGNHRVIVLDGSTGAYRRMWGAYGVTPPPAAADAAPPAGQPAPGSFEAVHGVELARDGKLYVSDRNHQRIQVFTRDGHYLAQFAVNPGMASPQTASGIALSADPAQTYLYVADWGNNELLVYDRAGMALVGKFGSKGAAPGQFTGPHLLATDSKGVLYVAEAQGRRVQRLVPQRAR